MLYQLYNVVANGKAHLATATGQQVRRDTQRIVPTSEEWTMTNSEGKHYEDMDIKETLMYMYKEQLKQSVKEFTTYNTDMEKLTHLDKMKKQINHNAIQQFVAAIIEGSDEETSTLKGTLANQFNLGMNQYLTTTTKALEMLNHFKGTKRPKPKANNQETQRNDQHGGENTKQTVNKDDKEVKEATTFVTKGNKTMKQALMLAVANDNDFGQEMDNYFQLCEVVTGMTHTEGTPNNEVAHCHLHYSNDNDELSSSMDTDYQVTDNNYDSINYDDDNFSYWAARDALDNNFGQHVTQAKSISGNNNSVRSES
ncbi:unnamed protein product, partial [Pseudo-nitzschia multistriata]